MRARLIRLAAFLVALVSATGPPAYAREGAEAPSGFQWTTDAPPKTMGEEYEADAANAQAEAIDDGERTPGLSPPGRLLVEEIVVQARKRSELLEDTPVAVTVISEDLLRVSGITRINQIQDLVPNMSINTGIEWAYRGNYHVLPPEVLAAHQSGYNLLNARLSYDFLDDRAQVALWAKNLLDQAYFDDALQTLGTFGFVSRFYEPPLTFGGELSYRF